MLSLTRLLIPTLACALIAEAALVQPSSSPGEETLHDHSILPIELIDQAASDLSDRPLTILIEEGTILPELFLLELEDEEPGRIKFDLSGPARFVVPVRRTLAERETSSGRIITPVIDPGHLYDTSVLRVRSQGQPILPPIQVVVLPKGWVAKLPEIPVIAEEALLFHSEFYAIADQAKVQWDRWEEFSGIHGHDHNVLQSVRPPQSLQQVPENFDPTVGDPEWCPGGCIRIPFGPGLVKWNVPSPFSLGWSVKPERSSALVPGMAPKQAIDGLYHRFWGCGLTLKVPDTCTATAGQGIGVECCCNHLWAIFGKVCEWKDPAVDLDDTWPICPL